MIVDPELLGKAHGLLAVMRPSDAGTAVLRDLVAEVERLGAGSSVEVFVGDGPVFAYATRHHTVLWSISGGPDLTTLTTMFGPIELRVMLALAEHVVGMLRDAANA